MPREFAGAIIGGTGLCNPEILDQATEVVMNTAYGDTTIYLGWWKHLPVIFLPRHGAGHSVPPHRINYRANIAALKEMGINRILASAAVGSLLPQLEPGVMAPASQFIDFTSQRDRTFFDSEEGPVVHADVTEPYCPDLRNLLRQEDHAGALFSRDVTYVCTEGPRFETPAEIEMFARLGGEVVGMTGLPEAVLAREAGLHYATLTLVTNYAAGRAGAPLSHQEVVDMMEANVDRIRHLFARVLSLPAVHEDCQCAQLDHF